MKSLTTLSFAVAIALGCLAAQAAKPVPTPLSTPTAIAQCQVISEPGPYILANNLPGNQGLLEGGDCLQITSDNVTLDGNGYSITGSDAGTGISASNWNHLTIRNVTVIDFYDGVDLDNTFASTIENVAALSNVRHGITAYSGQSNRVIGNYALSNGTTGLRVSARSVVKDNIANGNGNGIWTDVDAVVTGNTANANGIGIHVTCPAVLTGNVADGNSSADYEFGGSGVGDCATENNANTPAPG